MPACSAAVAAPATQPAAVPRWTVEEVLALYELPLMDLLWRAQAVHREHFDANAVQRSTLLSVKTGGCSEDCGYCSQSAFAETGLKAEKLMDVDAVLASAADAKAAGSQRFCMGAAWRSPKDRDMGAVCRMVEGVKAMGLEVVGSEKNAKGNTRKVYGIKK